MVSPTIKEGSFLVLEHRTGTQFSLLRTVSYGGTIVVHCHARLMRSLFLRHSFFFVSVRRQTDLGFIPSLGYFCFQSCFCSTTDRPRLLSESWILLFLNLVSARWQTDLGFLPSLGSLVGSRIFPLVLNARGFSRLSSLLYPFFI
jgi:hypothetical protein